MNCKLILDCSGYVFTLRRIKIRFLFYLSSQLVHCCNVFVFFSLVYSSLIVLKLHLNTIFGQPVGYVNVIHFLCLKLLLKKMWYHCKFRVCVIGNLHDTKAQWGTFYNKNSGPLDWEMHYGKSSQDVSNVDTRTPTQSSHGSDLTFFVTIHPLRSWLLRRAD